MAGQDLEGKVALVTGAARGQGRSHAARLAAAGVDVIAIDRCNEVGTVPYPMPSEADLEETCRLVRDQGRRAVKVVADVRDYAALQAATDDGVAELGRLDIVVANAGVASYAVAGEITDEQWTEMVDINLNGAWRTCRAALRHIEAGGRGGCIVLTGSVAGMRAIPHAAHYAASKHGLVGLMKVLAIELGPQNIRVNVIHPTTVNTGMVQNDASRELFLPDPGRPRTQEAYARVAQTLNVLPVPWIEPEAVSEMVAYLASESGRYITGAEIPVDAGMSQRW